MPAPGVAPEWSTLTVRIAENSWAEEVLRASPRCSEAEPAGLTARSGDTAQSRTYRGARDHLGLEQGGWYLPVSAKAH
jgi:hypothetical protein